MHCTFILLLLNGPMCGVQNPNGSGNMTASAWLTGSDHADSIFDDANGKANNVPHLTAASGDDVSTERRPGTFTNQQVPKNLTSSESSTESATASAEDAAAVAASGLADALPANLPVDLKQIGNNISAAVKNATANLTSVLKSTSSSGPVRQQLERVLDDGSSTIEAQGMQDGSSGVRQKGSLHGNTDMIGVGQYNSSSKRLLESTRMSQLFGVFGAVLVFALWMLRKRRKSHHSHNEPGLLGPGVDQGIGGWLRPRSGRHRLATA